MNKEFLSKIKWYVVLTTFSLLGIILTVIFRLVTPKSVVIPKNDFIRTNDSGNQTSFNNIKFTGDIPTLKEKLPLVKLQPSNMTVDYLKNRLIENNSLNPVNGVDGLWKGEKYTLSYNNQDKTYLFYSNFLPKDTVLTDKNKAMDIAEKYVADNFSELPLKMQKANIKKLSGLQEYLEVETGNISALEIPFTYYIDDIPLLVEHSSVPLLNILVNSSYEVQRATFQTNFFYPTQTDQSFNLITLGDAIDNINQKQYASIISAYEATSGIFSLDTVVAGDLNKVQLEYRADLKNGIAYPFYHFSGEIINQDNKKIQANIITPAVKIAE